jgi:nucleotidyltransferase substrate binding protein (TIGR01987 family)
MIGGEALDFTRKDLIAFGQCLARLEEMLARWSREPDDDAVRDSVVKRFELTYELSVQALLRYMASTSASTTKIAGYDFQDLIRKGDQAGLLRTGWPEWRQYREARNRTVPTYREQVAIQIAERARDFAQESRVLFDNLKKRMDTDA